MPTRLVPTNIPTERQCPVESEIEQRRIREVYARRKERIHADRYSYFNPGNLVIEQELEGYFLSSLTKLGRAPLRDKRILEVGCGSGPWLRNLIRWGAQPENLVGVDLLEERIEQARRLLPGSVCLTSGDATNLAFPDGTFDLVFQFTMLSSVLDDSVKREIAMEMLRVLKPDGCIISYDLHVNNARNPDVRGIGKQEILRLFPNCATFFRRLTFLPPAARALGPISPSLCRLLASVKIFSTHYLAFILKRRQDSVG
jgi:ubiquinone/menaquinone biosynthesis C-methylase UbiE